MIIQDKGNIKSIQKFIDKNWQKNHILTKNSKIFNWLHYNEFEKKYNFLIYKKNNNILGFLGILKNSKFSNDLKKFDTVWLTTWVAKKAELGSGIKLLMHSINNYKYSKIGTVGCDEKVKKIYQYLGFFTGELTQYYIVNEKMKVYKIGKFKKRYYTRSFKEDSSLKIVRNINFKKFELNCDNYVKLFEKNEDYFNNKYLKNPFYKYLVFEFVKKNKTIGYYFARECHYNGYKCLRIVDFFGNIKKIFDSSAPFKKIIETNNYEFVDLFFYGNIKNKSYFLKNNFKNNIIIPNYFEPFLKKNITINFAIMSIKKSSKLYLFKGDCDQERPNLLK